MKKIIFLSALAALIAFASFKKQNPLVAVGLPKATPADDTLLYPEEVHFKNLQQLTFGGDNAEAYWSYDSKYIVFQRTNPKEGLKCDRIFMGKVPQMTGDKFEYKMLSTGKGRTTCPFFTKDGKHIIYASTHLSADTCPPVPDRSKYG